MTDTPKPATDAEIETWRGDTEFFGVFCEDDRSAVVALVARIDQYRADLAAIRKHLDAGDVACDGGSRTWSLPDRVRIAVAASNSTEDRDRANVAETALAAALAREAKLRAALAELVACEFDDGTDGQPLATQLDTAGYYEMEERMRAALADDGAALAKAIEEVLADAPSGAPSYLVPIAAFDALRSAWRGKP